MLGEGDRSPKAPKAVTTCAQFGVKDPKQPRIVHDGGKTLCFKWHEKGGWEAISPQRATSNDTDRVRSHLGMAANNNAGQEQSHPTELQAMMLGRELLTLGCLGMVPETT